MHYQKDVYRMKKLIRNKTNNLSDSKKESIKTPKEHSLINSVLGSFTALSLEYLYLSNHANK